MAAVYRVAESVVASRVGEQIVLMTAEFGNYLGLNEVAGRIFEICREQPATPASIVDALVGEYQVEPDVCSLEVEQVLQEFIKHKILTTQ